MRMVTVLCSVCFSEIERSLSRIKYNKKTNLSEYKPVCSLDCKRKARENKQLVICTTCNKSSYRPPSRINTNGHNFCNNTCSAKFTNKYRKPNSPNKIKTIKCSGCSIEITSKINSVKDRCFSCKAKGKSSRCIICMAEIFSKRSKKKYCAPCRLLAVKKAGSKAGKISASIQRRRSKNEIYFSELCEKEFNKITNNDPIFASETGNWDADIIVHDYKVAVLWNGQWHYVKCNKKHSVAQVQARDKLKIRAIINNGYEPYIIKDMGKYNPKFVDGQFKIFKQWIGNRKINIL